MLYSQNNLGNSKGLILLNKLLFRHANNCKEACKKVYNYEYFGGVTPEDWQPLKSANNKPIIHQNPQTGYYGEAFTDGKTVFIVSRGTEPFSYSPDVYTDFQMLQMKAPNQLEDLKIFHDQLKNQGLLKGKKLIFTGHSLGGSLSQLGAAIYNAEAIAFSPYGTKPLMKSLGVDEKVLKSKIVNYTVDWDVVGNSGDQPGLTFYIPGPGARLFDKVKKIYNSPVSTDLTQKYYDVVDPHILSNFDGYLLNAPLLDWRISKTPSISTQVFRTLGESTRSLMAKLSGVNKPQNPTAFASSKIYFNTPAKMNVTKPILKRPLKRVKTLNTYSSSVLTNLSI